MLAVIDWAAARARMILTLVTLALFAGGLAYVGLPKEGEPDIEVPALFVSVPFPGISAADSETLLVRPMEQQLSGLTDLRQMSATAAQGYAGIVLEFEFGWDKNAAIADVRDRMSRAAADFPEGASNYSINEFNFSQFPVIIFAISGDVPERTLLSAARQVQAAIEGVEAVLSADISGVRDEMIEVIIDPLRLEAYNVTAGELINVITMNNRLVAAGDVQTETGSFSISLPGNFETPREIYDLPIKVNGDSVVTLGDLATIQPTFEDREGTARFEGDTTLAIQVVKRKGFNLIGSIAEVRAAVDALVATWPEELRASVSVTPALDRSYQVQSMIGQLEGSVLTAIALVMIVVLGSLGTRSALLVGFSIPTSFLLCFVLLGLMGVTISNIVMFGLILAVGLLVDGAVVVTEYADKRIDEGDKPMVAYTSAAKRMFWPVVASTATTLCAFLPLLFWPGVAGEFMGMLPVTLIFVLAASLLVALVFLPVLGGVMGDIAARFGEVSTRLRRLPWLMRLPVPALAAVMVWFGTMGMLNPALLGMAGAGGVGALLPGALLLMLGAMGLSIGMGAILPRRTAKRVASGHKRTPFGYAIKAIVGNPVMPFVAIAAVVFFVMQVFVFYGENNQGVSFFVDTEPEQGIIYVRARGNLSVAEKDALVAQVEEIVMAEPGVAASFSFAGDGGLNANTAGAQSPRDAIGQIQFELLQWNERGDDPDLRGQVVLDRMAAQFAQIPGIYTEYMIMTGGPAGAKPLHLRLTGQSFADLDQAVATVRARMAELPGVVDIEDTRPLPGIDWQIRVDTARAGRFGADVATVGGMVQLATRGLLLDTMRIETSDEEVEIRVRLPEDSRLISAIELLRVQTPQGMVPLSNFVTIEAMPLRGQIDRFDEERYFDVKAGVADNLVNVIAPDGETLRIVSRAEITPREHPEGSAAATAARQLRDGLLADGNRLVPITANERIEVISNWLTQETPLPEGVDWRWTGEQQDQAESTEFLTVAFSAALGLMFLILLAQFNSFYNSVLVLLAVILSTTGVLVGMVVMDQTFSIIMTGTGIMALAGIVVNNNIVLIDTYQEYSRFMPRIEAIIRTAEARIRPVLLTTITTMAGLAPMMFGISIDFFNGGYTVDSPAAIWWKQLATAVVFGLGVATVLTLVLTPALLAARIWVEQGVAAILPRLRALAPGRARSDLALQRQTRGVRRAEIIWDPAPVPAAAPAAPVEDLPELADGQTAPPLRAAE